MATNKGAYSYEHEDEHRLEQRMTNKAKARPTFCDPEKAAEAGRKSAELRRTPEGRQMLSEAGKKGAATTRARYGHAHFVAIGRRSGEVRRAKRAAAENDGSTVEPGAIIESGESNEVGRMTAHAEAAEHQSRRPD